MTSLLRTRRLIPRWRSTVQTLRQCEAASTNNSPIIRPIRENEAEFANATGIWHDTKAPGVLGDVLAFAVDPLFADRALAIGAEALRVGAPTTTLQRALIASWGTDSQLTIECAERAFSPESRPFQASIRRLRELLRFAPDNPLALLDFAQLQAAVGKVAAAERSLITALNLAPSNRLVLRTMARFLVHDGRPDEGHRLLNRHVRTPFDPWLMASEVATADAAGRLGDFLSKGRRLLQNKRDLRPDHLTELAGVIAMEELRGGSLKRAREAQRIALLAPNDNVVAQAVEFEAAFGISLNTPTVNAALTNAAEARLLKAWNSAEPHDVERHALLWHSEEPFSSRPVQLLTALYAFRGDLTQAVNWGKAGLLTDPTDRGLLINLSYAHAKAANFQAANHSIRLLRLHHRDTSEPYALATEGLIQYKLSDFSGGDQRYNAAADLFKLANMPQTEAYCRLNQAFAALDSDHPRLTEIFAAAELLLKKHPSQDSVMLIRTHGKSDLVLPDIRVEATRSLSQWIYNKELNTLTERSGITSIGASVFVPDSRKNS